MRERSIRAAPTSGRHDTTAGGRSNGSADADTRLGPVIEAVINGRYYWVPFGRTVEVEIAAPADLRDRVWIPRS